MSTAMVQYDETGANLALARSPEEVLVEAKRAAVALTTVIGMKQNPVKFNGETYLEFEDWQTVAKFYGCTVKIESTSYVQYGEVAGFEATAIVLDRNQAEISRAESLCLNDEENWGKVAKYEWQDELDEKGKKIWVDDPKAKNGKGYYKGGRVKTGEVAKPLFQLKSMAQTRAGARALRQVFAWVVVLAGYKPSVAEEMTGNEEPRNDADPSPRKETKPPVKEPQRASQAAVQTVAVQTVAGVIEKAKFGKNETLWITIPDEKLIMAAKEHVREDMLEGNFLSVEAKLAKSDKIGEYWTVTKVIKCEPVVDETQQVQEGEYEDTESEPVEAVSTVDPVVAEGLKDLFADGKLKKGTALPKQDVGTDGKPKIIGPKRAQHLHILISQNHKTTGFTEDEMTKLMHTHPLNIDHLRDLPYHMYEVAEKFCNGESQDWKG